MRKRSILCIGLFAAVMNQVVYSQCGMTLVANGTNAACVCSNGMAAVTISGGVAPYTYSWTNSTTPGSVSLLPSKDNSIYEQFMTNSNGAGEFMTAGTSATGFKHRSLMSFAIAGNIPAGVVITNVSLSLNLNLTSGQNGPRIHYLHKVTQDWGEGVSDAGGHPGQGSAAATNDATWLKSFYPDADWTIIGGNFNAVSSGSTLVDQSGFYNWSSAAMVADVQEWLDHPSSNFGWLLKSVEDGIREAKRYCTKENGTLENRPVLIINYGPRVISTQNFVSSLGPGNYTITVTDVNGCTASASVTISKI